MIPSETNPDVVAFIVRLNTHRPTYRTAEKLAAGLLAVILMDLLLAGLVHRMAEGLLFGLAIAMLVVGGFIATTWLIVTGGQAVLDALPSAKERDLLRRENLILRDELERARQQSYGAEPDPLAAERIMTIRQLRRDADRSLSAPAPIIQMPRRADPPRTIGAGPEPRS